MTYNDKDYNDKDHNASARTYKMTTGLITKGRVAGRFTDEGFSDAERKEAMGQ